MKRFIIFFAVVASCSCSKPDNNSTPPEVNIENAAPSVPVKVYPANGLLCTENPVEFRWNSATDKEGDIVTYEIEIASDASFTNIIKKISLNETEKTFTLEKGIELNWRVRAKDSNNDFKDFSPTWKFFTEGEGIVNHLPFTPTLLNPILNTKVSGSSAMLEWSSSDVDGDELVYDVYFGNTTPPTLIDQNTSDTSYIINIDAGQTYYWKIIVKDGEGGESIGDIWKFKS